MDTDLYLTTLQGTNSVKIEVARRELNRMRTMVLLPALECVRRGRWARRHARELAKNAGGRSLERTRVRTSVEPRVSTRFFRRDGGCYETRPHVPVRN